jgi:hypothetical protein
MKPKPYQYPFSEFLADVLYIEELKASWSWSSPEEYDALLCTYFAELYGAKDLDYAEWRYTKWRAVTVYVARNIQAFNFGDLAAVGSERALTRGKLFHPIFDYALEHDIRRDEDFPAPQHFHSPG